MKSGNMGVSNNHHEGHEDSEVKNLHALHELHGKKKPLQGGKPGDSPKSNIEIDLSK